MTISRLTSLLLNSTVIASQTLVRAPDGASSPPAKNRSKLAGQMLTLEPRILFDGALLDTALDAVHPLDAFSNDRGNTDDSSSLLAALAAQEPLLQSEVTESFTDSYSTRNQNLVFIDSAVEDIDILIGGMGPDVEIHLIGPGSDGVEQIATVLAGRTGIESLHIVSHGRSGTLDLGDAKLTEASMAGRHADEMAVIRSALSVDADVLLYGCDFAAGARGRDAVQALANATGADVAASDDLTGAANLGGD
jgi:Domain of unknown function (DUF4347)